MSRHSATVTGWHGYKAGADLAEVVITGYGFGTAVGTVKLNIPGTGKVDASVIAWTDTSIIVAAPADATIQRVHVYALDERGRPKQADQSPASETRSTGDATLPWTVSTVDDTLDHILLDGTTLENVQDVFLYDSSTPERVYEGSFLQNGTALEVDWPASFTSPITKLRLSDGNGGNVEEVAGGAAGLTPQANGVIDNVNTQIVGGSVLLNLLGSAFGANEGVVRLGKVGEPLEAAPVLNNSWTDSLVQVGADDGSTYDRIELERTDGEIATLGPNVPATITTPSLALNISILEQTAFGGPLSFRITGNRLDELGFINLNLNNAPPGTFNPNIWNADVFPATHPVNGPARNASVGIGSDPVFSPNEITFTIDAPDALARYGGAVITRIYVYDVSMVYRGFFITSMLPQAQIS